MTPTNTPSDSVGAMASELNGRMIAEAFTEAMVEAGVPVPSSMVSDEDVEKLDIVARKLRERLASSPSPRGRGAEVQGLHPATADLVRRFTDALADKLRAAEQKYGYSDGWLSPDWREECQRHLAEHVAKGDPRDVAAYAAFCWHHGWPTTLSEGSGKAEALRKALEPIARYVAVVDARDHRPLDDQTALAAMTGETRADGATVFQVITVGDLRRLAALSSEAGS